MTMMTDYPMKVNGTKFGPVDYTDPFPEQRMTSLEIAKVTGKHHYHVMQAIRKMEGAWEKVNQSKFGLVNYTDRKGEKRPCYSLTKTECLYVATKFNDEARARLVIRWEELERERRMYVPQPSFLPLQDEEIRRLRSENERLRYDNLCLCLELGNRYDIIRMYAPGALCAVRVPGYTTPAQPPPLPSPGRKRGGGE